MPVEVIGLTALRARLVAVGSPATRSGLLEKLAASGVRNAKLLVPRKTGNLGRSIHYAGLTATSVSVIASANYAADVELGTKPHEITPRVKKALRFAASPGGARLTGTPRVGADVVFATVVHHPGTRPHPYLEPGVQDAIKSSDFAATIVEAWNTAI